MRLPKHYRDTIDELFGRNCLLEARNRHLEAVNDYLLCAVELLSLPRTTEDEVRRVRDGLLALQAPSETRH